EHLPRCLRIHPFALTRADPRNRLDRSQRVARPHVEGMIGAYDYALRPGDVDEMPHRLGLVRERVEVEAPEQRPWRARLVDLRFRAHPGPVRKTPDLIRHVAAAVREQDA